MRIVSFFISSLLLSSGIVSAQKGPDFCNKFTEAAYDMNYANYEKALTVYQELVAQDPTNALLNYSLGFCILNTGTSNKADAVKYLEVAEKNYVKYGGAIDEDDCNEKKAPTTALLNLAMAYAYAGQFSKAAEKFELYSTSAKLKGEEKADIDRRVSQCAFADKQLKSPKKAVFTNLGPEINSPAADYDAFITEDEQFIYFNSRRKDFGNYAGMDGRYWESIFFSQKDGEKWISADLAGPNINEEENDAILGFSADGTKMLVYKDKKENGNIFLSENKSESWTTTVEYGPTINSKFKDRGATISPDGTTLIFASDKKGGIGGMDLYSSTRTNGSWGPATPIASLNTKYDEMAPSFSRDGKSLYFASNGYDVIGGLDIFVAKWNGSGYDAPENLGAPINTLDDDFFYSESLDGTHAYVSQNRKEGLGDLDIYMVTFPDKTPNNITLYSGNFKLTETVKEIPSSNKITVTNLADNSTKNYKVTADGKFSFILKPNGKYSVKIEQGSDVLFEDKNVVTPSSYSKMPHADIALPLTPEQVAALAKQAAEDKAKEEALAKAEAAKNAADKESNMDFKMNFQYNKKDITASNDFSDFSKLFIKAVKAGKVNVHLEACASKVPTSKYANNEALSMVRAEAAKAKIMELVTKNKLNPANVVFDKPDALVGGPEYNKDWNENRKNYEKFQYIYIKVNKLK